MTHADFLTEDFYRDLANDVETKFDTSGYSKDDNRPLPMGKYRKIGLFNGKTIYREQILFENK